MKILRLLFFMTVCLSVGWAGSWATQTSLQSWYAGLQKPPLNPPDAVFAPVWTLLYLLMGAAASRFWVAAHAERNTLRILFAAQLFLNAIWSFLFFYFRSPLAALIDIVMMWAVLFVLIKKLIRADRVSAALLSPYLAWISFAAYLNAALFWLNR